MTLDTQDEVEEAIEEDEEEYDRVEWPPFDGDGYAPKEPHALGERPKAVPGGPLPELNEEDLSAYMDWLAAGLEEAQR